MARRSLRSPASWATEINRQSRYPGGMVTPKIGAAAPSARPEAGAMEATTPASATTATSTKTIRLIRYLLHICVIAPMRHLAITDQGSAQAASQAIPHQGCRPRLVERSEHRADLGSEELRLFPGRKVSTFVERV